MVEKITNLAAYPAQTFTVVLNSPNRIFAQISLYTRNEWLYLDLLASGTPICYGALCLDGVDIIQSPNPDFPGTLHFADYLGRTPPRWDGLGERYQLFFVPIGEELPPRFLY